MSIYDQAVKDSQTYQRMAQKRAADSSTMLAQLASALPEFVSSGDTASSYTPSNSSRPSSSKQSFNGSLVQILQKAGFRGNGLRMALAISKAESGQRANAIGDVKLQNGTWGPSEGLFQIRSLRKQSGTGGNRDATRLLDALFNARAAYAISHGGTNWTPWSTYTNGAYRKYY